MLVLRQGIVQDLKDPQFVAFLKSFFLASQLKPRQEDLTLMREHLPAVIQKWRERERERVTAGEEKRVHMWRELCRGERVDNSG